MSKGAWSLLGFIFLIIGLSSLCLLLVGVQYAFLKWIDAFGSAFGVLLRLLFIMAGIIILFLTRTDFSGEDNSKTDKSSVE